MKCHMYQVFVYVPENYIEAIKAAMFASGAGQFNHYEQCCWQTKGVGQYTALEDANPSEGEIGKTHHVDEYRVELICQNKATLKKAVAAMKTAHPYEEVAYGVIKLEKI